MSIYSSDGALLIPSYIKGSNNVLVSDSTKLSSVTYHDIIPNYQVYSLYSTILKVLDLRTGILNDVIALPSSTYNFQCNATQDSIYFTQLSDNTITIKKLNLQNTTVSVLVTRSLLISTAISSVRMSLSSDNFIYLSQLSLIGSNRGLHIDKYDLSGLLINEYDTETSFIATTNNPSYTNLVGDSYGNMYIAYSGASSTNRDHDQIVIYDKDEDKFSDYQVNFNYGPSYLRLNCKVAGGIAYYTVRRSYSNTRVAVQLPIFPILDLSTSSTPTLAITGFLFIDYDGNIVTQSGTNIIKYKPNTEIIAQYEFSEVSSPLSGILLPNGDELYKWQTKVYLVKYGTTTPIYLTNTLNFTFIDNWNIGTHPELFNLE